MKKWDRSLGTSKREQGIATPKAPHNRSYARSFSFKKSRLPAKSPLEKWLDNFLPKTERRRDVFKNR